MFELLSSGHYGQSLPNPGVGRANFYMFSQLNFTVPFIYVKSSFKSSFLSKIYYVINIHLFKYFSHCPPRYKIPLTIPFLTTGSGGGARENAKFDFGTDLLRGIRLFSVGAEDRARGAFFRGESGGVFLSSNH